MVSGIIDASGQASSVLPRSGRINYGILDDRRPTEDLFGKITYDSEETWVLHTLILERVSLKLTAVEDNVADASS